MVPHARNSKAAPAAKPGRSESYNESGCGDMQPSQIAGYFRALFGAGTTCSRVKERAFSCSSVDFTSMGKAHSEAEDDHAVSHLAELALLWLIPLNSHQQIFFQPSPPLLEPLNLHFETIEALDDLAVLVTKRVEACVCRH